MAKGNCKNLCNVIKSLLITLLTVVSLCSTAQDYHTQNYIWPWLTVKHQSQDSALFFEHHLHARFNKPTPQFVSLTNLVRLRLGHQGFGATGGYNFAVLPHADVKPGWFHMFQFRLEHTSGIKKTKWLKRLTLDYVKIIEAGENPSDNKRVRTFMEITQRLSDKNSLDINDDIFILSSAKYFSENRFQAGLMRQINKNSLSMIYLNRWVKKGLVYKTNLIEHNLIVQYSIFI